MDQIMGFLGLLAGLLGLNVIVNVGVWFRLGNLTAKVDHVESRVVRLEASI